MKMFLISIHAPRVGRDKEGRAARIGAERFQSTRPVWGATISNAVPNLYIEFQSTRPVWGATTVF